MDAKTTGIVAYITWIGLVIAFVLGDREGAKFHLNQALVIWLAGLLSFIRFWCCYICYGALRWGHPLSAAAGSGSTGMSTARAAEGHGR